MARSSYSAGICSPSFLLSSLALIYPLLPLALAQSSSDGDDGSSYGPLGTGSIPISQATPAPPPEDNGDGDSDDGSSSGSSSYDTNMRTLTAIILIVVALLLVGIIVFAVIRRRKRLQQLRISRRMLDVEASRAQHGLTTWRTAAGGNPDQSIPMGTTQNTRVAAPSNAPPLRTRPRQEEGLDENGEAPPPYTPTSTSTGKSLDKELHVTTSTAESAASSPTSPTRPEPAHQR